MSIRDKIQDDGSSQSETIVRVFKQVASCATDGRATYSRFRQSQIIKLHNVLLEKKEAIIDAVCKDFKRPKFEITIEFLAVIRHIKALFVETDFHQLLSSAKADLKHGVISKPRGAVVIIAHQSSPLGSWICPLASVIASGNVAITVLPDAYTLLNTLIPACLTLDPSAYAFLHPSKPTITTLLSLKPAGIICTTFDSDLRVAVGHAAVPTGGHAVLYPPIVPGSTATSLSKVAAIISDSTSSMEICHIAKLVARGKFFNVGRGVSSIDYVLVHENHHPAFLDLLVEATREMFGGDAALSGDFGIVSETGEVQRLRTLLQDAVGEGKGKIMMGGIFDNTFVAPTVVDTVTRSSVLLQSRINGPILPVVPFSSLEDAISVQSVHPSHTLYIFGSQVDVTYLAQELPCTTVFSNDVPIEALIHIAPGDSQQSPSDLSLQFRSNTRIVRPNVTPLAAMNLFAPFGPSKILAIAKLIQSSNPVASHRVPHSPIMRRSFFPQGLFLMLGSAFTVTLGLTAWGAWKLVEFNRARS